MKINADFTLKYENGSYILISNSGNGVPVHLQNERVAFLWEYMSQNDCTKEQLLNALLKQFDISTVLALNDIDMFLKILKEMCIIGNE